MTKIQERKVSVLVPYFKSGKTIRNCLDSLLKQTYRNIEIIVVDDGSEEDLSELVDSYPTVKFVKHEKNRGLFRARVTGFYASTGDYVAFLDSDDVLSVDWVRSTVFKAEKTNADIVIADFLLDYGETYSYFPASEVWQSDLLLKEEQVQKKFFEQAGVDFSWHILCGKLYSRTVLEKAYEYLSEIQDHIVMCEDVLASSVIWTKAKVVTNVHDNFYFYNKTSETSTKATSSYADTKKKILNIIKIFDLIELYFQKNSEFKFINEVKVWRNRYINMWRNVAENVVEDKGDLVQLCDDNLHKSVQYEFDPKEDGFFYKEQLIQSLPFEEIKEKIVKADLVSFDVFDTLVTRPLLRPVDLFHLLDDFAREILGTFDSGSFAKIRAEAEWEARQFVWEQEKRCEVTLSEIYDVIARNFGKSRQLLEPLLEKECQYEIKYSQCRNAGKELFELAQYLGKDVYCISDMYLSDNVVRDILTKNGYNNFNLRVSSSTFKTKSTGEAFKEFGYIASEKCLHIGDNEHSDCEVPKKLGWNVAHLPRTVDVFLGKYPEIYKADFYQKLFSSSFDFIDTKAALEFIGIRAMLAQVANKIFDNPFRNVYGDSDFGYSSNFIGYFPLGMYLWAITRWLYCGTKNFDNLTFVARDGWLAKKAFDLFVNQKKDAPVTHYFNVSRKSVIPLYVHNKADLVSVVNALPSFENRTAIDIINLVRPGISESLLKELNSELSKEGLGLYTTLRNKEIKTKIINVIDKQLLNGKKHPLLEVGFRKYLANFFEGKAATFDVGYSGRFENVLNNLFGFTVTPFYIHLNSDIGVARLGDVKTLYSYSPLSKGTMREWLMSEFGPSCIGYEEKDVGFAPVLEQERAEYTYSVKTSTKLAQDSALLFVQDLLESFGDDLDKLFFRDIDACMPFEYFLQSAKDEDKYFLSTVNFEDDLGSVQKLNLVDNWIKWQLSHVHLYPGFPLAHHNGSELPSFLKKKGFKAGIKKGLFWWLTDRKMFKLKKKKFVDQIKHPFSKKN